MTQSALFLYGLADELVFEPEAQGGFLHARLAEPLARSRLKLGRVATLCKLAACFRPEPFWMPFDAAAFELGDILADAQIMRLGRAWKLPILLSKRVKTIQRFFAG